MESPAAGVRPSGSKAKAAQAHQPALAAPPQVSGHLVMFSTETRRPVRTIARHSARPVRLPFQSRREKLAALFSDQTAAVFRVADGAELWRGRDSVNTVALEFLPDSSGLVIAAPALGIFREPISENSHPKNTNDPAIEAVSKSVASAETTRTGFNRK